MIPALGESGATIELLPRMLALLCHPQYYLCPAFGADFLILFFLHTVYFVLIFYQNLFRHLYNFNRFRDIFP